MIKRIWRGWTTPGDADAYEDILLSHVIPGIEAKRVHGFRSIEVLREALDDEIEFCTIMTFDALADVRAFAGDDYATAYVPDRAREVLSRWDHVARHYEVRAHRPQSEGQS